MLLSDNTSYKIKHIAVWSTTLLSILLWIMLCFPFNGLIAEEAAQEEDTVKPRPFFQFNYRIDNFPLLKNNQVEFLRAPERLSFFRDSSYFITKHAINIVREFDFEQEKIVFKPKLGPNIDIFYPISMPLESFLQNNLNKQFRSLLTEKMEEFLREEDRVAQQGLIPDIVIDLPTSALPRSVRRIMGTQAGRLRLDGRQRITFTGTSTNREDRRVTERGDGKSFSMEMRQELNLTLTGTIGEKIFVNVRHSSESDVGFGDPSTIEIEYRGDEDEIVQSIKAGNISFSLTGSEFIRYSASSAGLFGVRSDLKVGNLEVTTVISKEEAQKTSRRFTGTGAADSLNYRSRDFVNRTHYYVVDPYDLFDLYTEEEAEENENVPAAWANNAIKTAGDGTWYVKNPALLPRAGSLIVYLDDGIATNNEGTIPGWEWDETGGPPQGSPPFNFDILEVNTDYFINYDTGVLIINRSVDRRFTIGVVYETEDGINIGDSDENNLQVKLIRRSNQRADYDTWIYQVRNTYNLNRRNIQNEGFSLNFFSRNADGTLNYFADESVAPGWELNDYLRLDSNNDGIINGYDSTVDLANGYIILPYIEPFRGFSDEIIYETETFSTEDNDNINITMSVVGKVGRDRIELGQMNLLRGSVRVVVDGETLQENVHYLVDYDFGNITLLTEKGRDPDARIEVNYEYVPLFSIDSKTLMGFRADYNFSQHTRLGGTFIYHSERVSDRRPTIGNENRTLVMGDIDGRVEFDPPLLTKMVDMIPLVRTDEDSNVRLSGEVAMTVPRIYGSDDQANKKEIYVDDMERIVDSYPLGLTRLGWSPASKPLGTPLLRARPNWYNPDDILAKDVYSSEFLTYKEQNEKVSVLTLRAIPPEVENPGMNNRYWGGIMRYLGNELDFSDKKYIEVLVKVDKYNHQPVEPEVTLFIDLGDISENFYVWNGGKGVLNTEDGANGGIVDGILEPREDVGLDGIPEGMPGDDPWDYFSTYRDENGDYPFINGTSGNGILDTEDLNGNGVLDMLNRYYQFSISLNSLDYESEYNGWRLYRIPIDSGTIKTDSATKPDLRRVSFARVWMEVEELTRVRIAKLDIVGNRWQENYIKDDQDRVVDPIELENFNESFSVSVVDNRNNRDHYVSPPGTTITEDGIPLLEQSLAVDYFNLQQKHHALVIQRFREAQNLLSYGKFRYWIYLERHSGNNYNYNKGDQTIIFRVGADSTNYYEVRYPALALAYDQGGGKMSESGWIELEVDFSDLSVMKQRMEPGETVYNYSKPIVVGGQPDSLHFRMVGTRVTLSNIRQMSVGVENKGTHPFSGRLYVNDIRVADPFEDVGYAARLSLDTRFADFSTLNVGLQWRSQNFDTSTTRTRAARTGNEESLSLDITNRYFLHKFFPPGWGLNMPLTLTRNQSQGIPRFKANSDILREDIEDDEEREREKRETLTQSADLTFRQTQRPSSRLVYYTVYNTTLRGNIRKTENLTSTNADTTLIYSGNMNYKLSFPREKLGFNVAPDYRIFFFPHTFDNNAGFRAEYPNRWYWNTNLPDTVMVKWTQRDSNERRDLDLSTNISFDLTTDLRGTYGFSQKRDLTKESLTVGDINIGTEMERDQNITMQYNPTFFSNIYTFNANANIRYRETNRPVSQHQAQDDQEHLLDGNVSRNLKFNLTLRNKDLLSRYRSRTLPGVSRPSTPSRPEPDRPEPPKFEDGTSFSPPDEYSDRMKMLEERMQRARSDEERRRVMEEMDRLALEMQDHEKLEFDMPDDRKPDLEPEKEDSEQEKKTEEEKPPRERTQINVVERLISFIAGIDNLNLGYENTYTTRFTRWEKRPDFWYQIGIPGRVKNEQEELDIKTLTDVYTASTGIPILRNLSTNWSYSLTIDKRYSSSSQKTVTRVFPNVRMTYTEFEKLIRAQNVLTSSRITSNYSFTRREQGTIDWDNDEWERPNSRQETNSFTPLLGWTGNWVNNITTSITLNHSTTQTTTFRETFNLVRKGESSSITGNFGYSFRQGQGINIPFINTRIQIENEFSTDVSVSVEQNYDTTQGQAEKIIERDTFRYTINPNITYNFSRNIKGGLSSRYEKSKDRRRDEGLTIFSLSIWAEILF